MEIYVLDNNYYPIYAVDKYESLLWTERYNQYSDFELVIPVQDAALEFLRPGNYVMKTDSKKTMIIEDVPIETDAEQGDRIILSGRSLESILDRRIVWEQSTLNTNLEEAIASLLTTHVISPSVNARKIDNLIFQVSGDTSITSINVQSQYYGEYIYTVIEDLCKLYNVGFKIELNATKQMVFQLFTGTDRSLAQSVNPPVIFSPAFDNLISSTYIESTKTYKNVALVAGERVGTSRWTVTVGDNALTGLNRRELFIEENISTNGATDPENYNQQLMTRGREVLAEHSLAYTFEGEADPNVMFIYNVDYFVGDVVQMVNEYGIENRARLSELITSYSREGMSLVTTFTVL